MSWVKLKPGDRVYFRQNGRRLRAVVLDGFMLRNGPEPLHVPVVRVRKSEKCFADLIGARPRRIRWIPRSELRKLPG